MLAFLLTCFCVYEKIIKGVCLWACVCPSVKGGLIRFRQVCIPTTNYLANTDWRRSHFLLWNAPSGPTSVHILTSNLTLSIINCEEFQVVHKNVVHPGRGATMMPNWKKKENEMPPSEHDHTVYDRSWLKRRPTSRELHCDIGHFLFPEQKHFRLNTKQQGYNVVWAVLHNFLKNYSV